MKQFSNDGSPVELELISGELLFIDPLYFQNIISRKGEVENLSREDKVAFIRKVEESVFPYGGGTLLGYKRVSSEGGAFMFDVREMHQFDDEDSNLEMLAADKKITAFSTDSGTFLIVDLANFDKLLDCITYDELIDAALESRLESYFLKINASVGNQGWAFIETPGVDRGYVFQGSGSFILNKEHVS